MSEFLDLVEQIRLEDAYTDRVWQGEGRNVSRITNRHPNYNRNFLEAAKFIDRFYRGRVSRQRFLEAMSTSDFPLYFGDVIDRQALGAYQEWPATYRSIARIGSVPDFRTVKRFAMNGAEAAMTTSLSQGDPYPAANLAEVRYTYSVAKYGRRLPFFWETIINDDLDLLKDAPARFGRAARRSEERFATSLFCGTSGPDATFYSNTNKNIVNITNGATSTNPALSIMALQDAMTVLGKQQDADGEPIVIEAVVLVIPPALEVIANNILNATEILTGNFPTTGVNEQIRSVNWMKNRVSLQVNPQLNKIATTNGDTSWYLFAATGVGRPALEVGFLRGYEQPQIFMKQPNSIRVGGGTIDPMVGSFDDDTIDYKLRHVFGGTTIDPKMSVASNGSGS